EARPGVDAFVSGQAAIQHDLDPIFSRDLKKGESIAVPIALLVLCAVFGLSLAATIPFLFAAATITGTLGIVYVVAHFMTMATYVTNLVQLIGLGIAIDYSLLIVYRFREELHRTDSKDDAIVRTMETAGRAVLFSGATVAIGLALLLFMPSPFMRSMGLGGGRPAAPAGRARLGAPQVRRGRRRVVADADRDRLGPAWWRDRAPRPDRDQADDRECAARLGGAVRPIRTVTAVPRPEQPVRAGRRRGRARVRRGRRAALRAPFARRDHPGRELADRRARARRRRTAAGGRLHRPL